MEKFIKKNDLLIFEDNDYGIIFTTLESGNMAYQASGDNVLDNRRKVSSKLNVELDDFIFAKQCHSANIAEVTSDDRTRGVYSFEDGIEDVDGLYTFDNNLVLSAFYADCTPVYIMSPKNNLTCIIHAGWQGTVKAIVYKALEHFKTIGISTNDIKVVIGPSISYDKFEVESDVIEQINKLSMIDYNACYTQINDIKYKADVKKINKLQAMAAGVSEQNIYVSSLCSFICDDLFSYRQNNQTGRMIACIYKK